MCWMDGISPGPARNATALSPRFVARPLTTLKTRQGAVTVLAAGCHFHRQQPQLSVQVVTVAAVGCVLASPPLCYRVDRPRRPRARCSPPKSVSCMAGPPDPSSSGSYAQYVLLRGPLIPVYGTTVFSFHADTTP